MVFEPVDNVPCPTVGIVIDHHDADLSSVRNVIGRDLQRFEQADERLVPFVGTHVDAESEHGTRVAGPVGPTFRLDSSPRPPLICINSAAMARESIDNELAMTDYLAILRRRWPYVAAAMLATVTFALSYAVAREDRFESTSVVLISGSAAQDALLQASLNPSLLTRQLENEISFARSDSVTAAVAEEFGRIPDVEITAASTSDLLEFTASGDDPEQVARAANVWAVTYVAEKGDVASASIVGAVADFEQELAVLRVRREELRAPLAELRTQLTRASDTGRPVIEAQIAELEGDLEPDLNLIDSRIDAISRGIVDLELSGQLAAQGGTQIVQFAAVPTDPVNSPLSRNLVLAIVVGSILGLAAALLAENLDRSIKSPDDVVALTDYPVLGSIPMASRHELEREVALSVHLEPDSKIADAYHKVRSTLQFSIIDGDIRSIMVTSANQAEGKTTTSVNLALALTSIGKRVTLADVDFRRPRVHRVFGCDSQPGLSNHSLDGVPLGKLAWHATHRGNSLVVLPTGTLPPNPSEFVGSPRFASLIAELVAEAEIVIVDAAPLLPVSDSITLARIVDATIITVLAGTTRRDELARSIASVEQVGGRILGVVLIGVSSPGNHYYYDGVEVTEHGPLAFRKVTRWLRGTAGALSASLSGNSTDRTSSAGNDGPQRAEAEPDSATNTGPPVADTRTNGHSPERPLLDRLPANGRPATNGHRPAHLADPAHPANAAPLLDLTNDDDQASAAKSAVAD